MSKVKHHFRAVSRFLTTETVFNRLSTRVGDRPVLHGEDTDSLGVDSAWFENERSTDFPLSESGQYSGSIDNAVGEHDCLNRDGWKIDDDTMDAIRSQPSKSTIFDKLRVQPRVQPLIGVDPGEHDSSGNSGVEKTVDSPGDLQKKSAMKKKKRKQSNSQTQSALEPETGQGCDTMSAELRELTRTIQRLDRTLQGHIRAMHKSRPPVPQLSAADRQGIDMSHRANDPIEDEIKLRTVFIRVVFLKLGEIETVKETFAADAFIQAGWRETRLDGKENMDEDDIDWDKYWNPKLYIDNLLGEAKETVWHSVSFDDKEQATVYEKRRLKGSFLENMELNSFPFDTQDLTITITSERPETEIVLEEDQNEICSINVQSFVDEQEWNLHCHVDTRIRTIVHEYRNSHHKFPAISASCKARRRSGFFIWNILVVMLFICSLSFATFTVHDEKPQNRLQLSFTLVLTTIAFKFTANQSLPKISYLTYLDKYILTSMGILCCICVWHSIIPLIKERHGLSTAISADRWALGVLGAAYMLFHIGFFSWIYFTTKRTRRNFERKDKEHKAKQERIKYNPDQDKRVLMRKILPMF